MWRIRVAGLAAGVAVWENKDAQIKRMINYVENPHKN